MKITLPFLAAATLVIASGCSSAYKTAQTPDDVYYSNPSKSSRQVSGDDQPEYYSTSNSNDQYVQMKVQDEARWSYFDDYNYYDSYCAPGIGGGGYYGGYYGGYPGAGFGFGFGGNGYYLNPYNYWNSYYAWNSYYNPYFYNPYYGGGMVIVNPKYSPYGTTAYSGLRTFSPASYAPVTYRPVGNTLSNGNRFYTPTQGVSRSNNTNNNFIRGTSQNNNTYYRPINNNTNTGNNSHYQAPSQPVRTYTPSSSGGGGSGGGGISRPGRF